MQTRRIRGISVADYLHGREERTLANYRAACRVVWHHADTLGISVFQWGEGELAGLVVQLVREGKGENMMKKVSAVVNMLHEAAGHSPEL